MKTPKMYGSFVSDISFRNKKIQKWLMKNWVGGFIGLVYGLFAFGISFFGFMDNIKVLFFPIIKLGEALALTFPFLVGGIGYVVWIILSIIISVFAGAFIQQIIRKK